VIRAVIFDCDGTLMNVESGSPTVYPGIPELLQRLEENEFQLYIWTGRDSASLQKFLLHFSLAKYFTDIRTANDSAPKPHPEGLRQMLKGINPSQCVVIGDSWADMKGATNFGAHGIGALWNKGAHGETLTEFGAKTLVSSPLDCYTVILSL